MNSIFITGTDTGVGKTFVATGIAASLKERGICAGVMKPIHTGCKTRRGRLIPEDSIRLAKSASVDDPIDLITPYTFKKSVAPHVAAIETHTRIDINRIVKSFRILHKRHEYMIVEGIGGVLVPITQGFYVADLIKRLKIPALIVIRPNLGTINHTMLTIHCLRERKIPIKGIVINYSSKGRKTSAEKTLPETIQRLSGLPVLGIIPYMPGDRIPTCRSFLPIIDKLLDLRQ